MSEESQEFDQQLREEILNRINKRIGDLKWYHLQQNT